MELTDEQLEIIMEASREIDFGRITVNFTGNPSYVVEIIAEKNVRFLREKADGTPHRRPLLTNRKP